MGCNDKGEAGAAHRINHRSPLLVVPALEHVMSLRIPGAVGARPGLRHRLGPPLQRGPQPLRALVEVPAAQGPARPSERAVLAGQAFALRRGHALGGLQEADNHQRRAPVSQVFRREQVCSGGRASLQEFSSLPERQGTRRAAPSTMSFRCCAFSSRSATRDGAPPGVL